MKVRWYCSEKPSHSDLNDCSIGKGSDDNNASALNFAHSIDRYVSNCLRSRVNTEPRSVFASVANAIAIASCICTFNESISLATTVLLRFNKLSPSVLIRSFRLFICSWKPDVCEETIQTMVGTIKETSRKS